MNEPVAVMDVVTRDCGYGFSGYALMSDGSKTAETRVLYASSERAADAVAAALESASAGVAAAAAQSCSEDGAEPESESSMRP